MGLRLFAWTSARIHDVGVVPIACVCMHAVGVFPIACVFVYMSVSVPVRMFQLVSCWDTLLVFFILFGYAIHFHVCVFWIFIVLLCCLLYVCFSFPYLSIYIVLILHIYPSIYSVGHPTFPSFLDPIPESLNPTSAVRHHDNPLLPQP